YARPVFPFFDAFHSASTDARSSRVRFTRLFDGLPPESVASGQLCRRLELAQIQREGLRGTHAVRQVKEAAILVGRRRDGMGSLHGTEATTVGSGGRSARRCSLTHADTASASAQLSWRMRRTSASAKPAARRAWPTLGRSALVSISSGISLRPRPPS